MNYYSILLKEIINFYYFAIIQELSVDDFSFDADAFDPSLIIFIACAWITCV